MRLLSGPIPPCCATLRAARFNIIHLCQPAEVALLPRESRSEECLDQLSRKLDADDTGAKAKDIHVVVLDSLMGGLGVVAKAGANTVNLVCGDGRAGA